MTIYPGTSRTFLLLDIQASWHPLVDMFVVGRYPKADDRNEKGRRALTNSDRGVIDFFDVNSEKPAFNLVDPSRKGLFPVCENLTIYNLITMRLHGA